MGVDPGLLVHAQHREHEQVPRVGKHHRERPGCAGAARWPDGRPRCPCSRSQPGPRHRTSTGASAATPPPRPGAPRQQNALANSGAGWPRSFPGRPRRSGAGGSPTPAPRRPAPRSALAGAGRSSGHVGWLSRVPASFGNHSRTMARHCSSLIVGPPGDMPAATAGATYLATVERSTPKLAATCFLELGPRTRCGQDPPQHRLLRTSSLPCRLRLSGGEGELLLWEDRVRKTLIEGVGNYLIVSAPSRAGFRDRQQGGDSRRTCVRP